MLQLLDLVESILGYSGLLFPARLCRIVLLFLLAVALYAHTSLGSVALAKTWALSVLARPFRGERRSRLRVMHLILNLLDHFKVVYVSHPAVLCSLGLPLLHCIVLKLLD